MFLLELFDQLLVSIYLVVSRIVVLFQLFLVHNACLLSQLLIYAQQLFSVLLQHVLLVFVHRKLVFQLL